MLTAFKPFIATIALLLLGLVGPLQAGVVVESPGAMIAGKTIGEWTAAWWQWATALAPPGDPFTDTTGEFAGVNQSGPVFFLAGSPGGSRSRQFQVPSDKYILVPLLAGEWSQLELGFDKTAAYIRQAAQQQANQINSLHATLDGVSIPQATLFTHREASPDFSFLAVAGNSVNVPPGDSGIAVADGYFLMLAPLSPGTHVLTYGGAAPVLGVTVSETDTITAVGPPPTIVSQPVDQTVFISSNATFSVSATTTNPPLRFQWQFNGADLLGATNDSLTISNAQVVNTGGYSVVITDSSGFTNSSVAYLTLLNLPPSISFQPTNLVVPAGTTATFSVNAEGTMPLFFQWFFNEAKLEGATSSTVVVTNAQSHHVGHYTVVITNNYGAVTSSMAALRLLAWTRLYNGPANDYDEVRGVAIDGNGDVVVAGVSCANVYSCDYYVAKYAASDGALLWQKRYNGPNGGDDSLTSLALDRSGNVVVAGASQNGPPNDDTDYYTAKYAATDGTLLWEKRYDGPGNGNDYPNAIAIDSAGNVLVTGGSVNGPPSYAWAYCTIKYAASDGTVIWEKRYNGPADYIDEGRALAVDGNDDVLVTGASYNANGNSDFHTIKYAGVDGSFLWQRRYNGPANLSDDPNAVVIDSKGNVVVAGFSYSASQNADYYTAKYSGANGAFLWERRYNGPVNGFDIAWDVAVDSLDNVVVTGGSTGGAPNYGSDFYTAKYAAPNGALLWAKRHSGEGRAMVVDRNDNVLVVGYSGNGSALFAYASGDGAELWEYRYPSSLLSRLAIDANGNIVMAGSVERINFDTLTLKIQPDPLPPVIPGITSVLLTNGSLQLEWTPITGYTLWQTPSLTAPNWQSVPGSMNTNRITLSITNTSEFFQLVKP